MASKAETPRPNGAAVALPEGWEEWPTLTQAANLLGISKERLTKHVKRGDVRKHDAPNSKGSALGSYRFDPAELNRLEAMIAEEDEGSDAPAPQPTTADTARAANEGMKQAQAHAERLVTLFEAPFNSVLKTLQDENAALRAECAALRADRAKVEELREEVRSTKAAESIALAQLASEQSTKDEALKLAKPVVQHFINAALLKGGVDPKLIALHQAVSSIPRETFEALFAAELLPAEIVEKLKVGLAWEEVKP